MTDPIPLDDLEIIAYATRLDDDMLPAVVAPIFRWRTDPEQVVLPPFALQDGLAFRATVRPASELDVLEVKQQVTRIDEPIPARPRFELWIDVDRRPRYERVEVANRNLGKIAEAAIEEAKTALAHGELDAAARQAGMALAADDRRIEPPALLSAVRRLQGIGGTGLMYEVARNRIGREPFASLVRYYVALFRAPSDGPRDGVGALVSASSRRVHGMATLNPTRM